MLNDFTCNHSFQHCLRGHVLRQGILTCLQPGRSHHLTAKQNKEPGVLDNPAFIQVIGKLVQGGTGRQGINQSISRHSKSSILKLLVFDKGNGGHRQRHKRPHHKQTKQQGSHTRFLWIICHHAFASNVCNCVVTGPFA